MMGLRINNKWTADIMLQSVETIALLDVGVWCHKHFFVSNVSIILMYCSFLCVLFWCQPIVHKQKKKKWLFIKAYTADTKFVCLQIWEKFKFTEF